MSSFIVLSTDSVRELCHTALAFIGEYRIQKIERLMNHTFTYWFGRPRRFKNEETKIKWLKENGYSFAVRNSYWEEAASAYSYTEEWLNDLLTVCDVKDADSDEPKVVHLTAKVVAEIKRLNWQTYPDFNVAVLYED